MIQGLMNQDIYLYQRTAHDRYGKPTTGTGTLYKCRFEKTNKTITTATNEREPIDGIVFVGPQCPVRPGDRVQYGDEHYRVLRCSDIVVGNGSVHHKEFMVQLWVLA